MTNIPWLQANDYSFPSCETALKEPNGLLAVGGDLNPGRLLHAYRQGIFPWYEQSQPILWWSPSPRTILYPDKIKISRSLRKSLRQNNHRVSCDTAFVDVITACANVARKGQSGSWITTPMINAYTSLNTMGIAHSIEVWFDNKLAGGLYGIAIGKVFFGESMFSRQPNSSKIALVYLAEQLHNWGFALIDCQVGNPHLYSMGAEQISREKFTAIVKENTDREGPLAWPSHWSTTIHNKSSPL